MAPEQVAGGTVDHRADIFAVGGVLYTLLAGQSPFEGPTLGAICANIESEPPRPLAELGVDVSPRLEAIITRSLEKAPEDRYQTVSELAEGLRGVSVELKAAASAPTVVTPQPKAARPGTSPPSGRRRRLVVGMALLLIVSAAALWALPGSPLRPSDEGQFAGGGDVPAGGEPASNPVLTPDSDPATDASSDSLKDDSVAEAAPDDADAAADEDDSVASSETAGDNTADADLGPSEGTGTAGDAGKAGGDSDATPALTLYPASSRERAEVNRIAAALVRGLQNKDSTRIAQAFGGELTTNQWRAFDRLLDGPRLKIRYTVGEVASAADGRVIAEIHNDILFQGPPGRVPAPRRATWIMRLQSNQYGQLQLRSLRLR
jgi:hypothetical protein